ncbi:hypothetical protein BsWGS_18926 [Bradybaena similaris]
MTYALVSPSTGRGCFYSGVMYKNGSEFKDEDQCQNCRCNNGLTECTPCEKEHPKASDKSS